MKKMTKRLTALGLVALLVGALLFLPVLPWSARCRHVVKKIAAKAEMKIAAWRGVAPRLITLSGRIVAPPQATQGAEVEALDSVSGWAAFADARGEFVLPDVLWYPRASYTLVVTLNDYQRRQVQLDAPAQYPAGGLLNLGELALQDCCAIEAANLQGQTAVSYIDYDRANRAYYQSLFDELAAARASDEEKLEAIARYVAGKLTADDSADQAVPSRYMNGESPRRVLETGSRHCSKLVLAFATLAEAGNYKTRILDLIDEPQQPSAHMVAEVYYGDRWHLYDPVAGSAFRRPDGQIASYKEVRLESRASFPRQLPAHLPALREPHGERVARLYRSGLHHTYYLKP